MMSISDNLQPIGWESGGTEQEVEEEEEVEVPALQKPSASHHPPPNYKLEVKDDRYQLVG